VNQEGEVKSGRCTENDAGGPDRERRPGARVDRRACSACSTANWKVTERCEGRGDEIAGNDHQLPIISLDEMRSWNASTSTETSPGTPTPVQEEETVAALLGLGSVRLQRHK
jgi:hypothetical protein